MENISIRKLEIEDADQIGQIYSDITRKPAKEDFKRLMERHARRAEDACFVAELEGKVVGFMVSYILTLGFGIEKSAWIATLGISPQYMGQGIGKSLAEEVFKCYQAEGISAVYTSVRWDSVDLLSFFKTLGFDRSNFINLRRALE